MTAHVETVALLEALTVDVGRGRMHTAMPADPAHVAAETGITELEARAAVVAALTLERTTTLGDVSIGPMARARKPAHVRALRSAGLAQ